MTNNRDLDEVRKRPAGCWKKMNLRTLPTPNVFLQSSWFSSLIIYEQFSSLSRISSIPEYSASFCIINCDFGPHDSGPHRGTKKAIFPESFLLQRTPFLPPQLQIRQSESINLPAQPNLNPLPDHPIGMTAAPPLFSRLFSSRACVDAMSPRGSAPYFSHHFSVSFHFFLLGICSTVSVH